MCQKYSWNDGIIELPNFNDKDGSLCPIEFTILPFIPKRIFYVTNTPKYTWRGKHAHWTTEQVLICLQGEILVSLITRQAHLFKLYPNDALYIPNLVWDSQQYLTGNDILLVLSSTSYNKSDYITDLKEFWRIIGV